MSLKTKQEYFDTIKRLNTEIYAFGERVRDVTEHPCLRPPVKCPLAWSMSYPEWKNTKTFSLLIPPLPSVSARKA